MIGLLNGTVAIRDDPFLIINIGGVGYRVHASQDVLSASSLGQEIKVFTYTHVREDELSLYGFLRYEDLRLFESIINVSGVGPRTGIGIFSVGSGDEIKQAIMDANVSFFTSVPRLGSKNAQKIIIELKSKVGGGLLDLSGDGASGEVGAALKTFGFSQKEISEAIRNIDNSKSVEEQIRLALKNLGR